MRRPMQLPAMRTPERGSLSHPLACRAPGRPECSCVSHPIASRGLGSVGWGFFHAAHVASVGGTRFFIHSNKKGTTL